MNSVSDTGYYLPVDSVVGQANSADSGRYHEAPLKPPAGTSLSMRMSPFIALPLAVCLCGFDLCRIKYVFA